MLTQFITILIFVAVIGCILYGRRLIRTEKVDAVFGNPERAKGGTHWVIVGTSAIMYVASIFGYYEYIEINAFVTGSMAIGIISGAYSTEVFRGAIQSIDKGQFEAAKVLGINKFGQFYKIILPQMLRLAIPNLSNVWQITLKDTSLISVTGLVEIMRQSYIAAGSTRDPLFFYSFAAVLYLMLTYLSMKLINKLELMYSKGY